MPAKNNSLNDRLSRYREITITVTGRKSGGAISIPVWFVYENGKLFLLPVRGSDTQWYKNVLENPSMQIDVRGTEAEVQAISITDAKQVSSVIEKFRSKYGTGDVKKYYSKCDVAVVPRRTKSHTSARSRRLRWIGRAAVQPATRIYGFTIGWPSELAFLGLLIVPCC